MLSCAVCKLESLALIEVFDTTCQTVTADGQEVEPHGKKLCQKCIVGKTVPVLLREAAADDVWQMCEIEAHNDGDQYSVIVGEDVKEKVTISSFPFADYIQHYRKEKPSTSGQKFTAMLLQDMFDDGVSPNNPNNNNNCSDLSRRILKHPGKVACHHVEDWTLDSVIRSSKLSPLKAPTPPRPETGGGATIMPPAVAVTPIVLKTPSRTTPKRKRDASSTPRKSLPRTWTAKEDKQLMQLVEKGPQPTKWSDLAHLMAERSGKQCRERYLNHLKPKLRFEEWTPQEDVQLCTLFQSMGSKWAIMAKIIKGRTDNSIKNRFHHIRRRLDKDVARIVKTRKIDEVASLIHIDAICRTPLRSETNSEFAMRARQILPYLAADSVKENINRTQFGPFVPAKGDLCQRCNFVAPSNQTGRLVSKKTGWCESCTKLPPYVVGDMLRQCLHLRKERVL